MKKYLALIGMTLYIPAASYGTCTSTLFDVGLYGSGIDSTLSGAQANAKIDCETNQAEEMVLYKLQSCINYCASQACAMTGIGVHSAECEIDTVNYKIEFLDDNSIQYTGYANGEGEVYCTCD